MTRPFAGWFEITGLTFAFADRESHVVGLSGGAVR
jgi:hypothetical protein